MAKPRLQFVKRRGHDLTVADDTGEKHRATITKVEDAAAVRDDGAFTFGYCKSCDWVGSARRSRGKARTDAASHLQDCSGRGKVRIGLADG